jgi:hypothetical protein
MNLNIGLFTEIIKQFNLGTINALLMVHSNLLIINHSLRHLFYIIQKYN